MSWKLRAFSPVVLSAGLFGCGGEDGPAPPPPPPPPLSIISATTASVEENATAAFYQATATGGAGAIRFTLGNTQDATYFTISAAGALRFTDPPNYDLENDFDNDNVFDLRLIAQSGSQSVSIPLSVTLENSREGIRVTRIVTGLVEPRALTGTDVSDEIFVAEKSGRILAFEGSTGVMMREVVPASTIPDYELMDIAFGVAGNYPLDLSVLARRGDGLGVRRPLVGMFGVERSASVGAVGAERDVQTVLGFGPDGIMYAAIGNPDNATLVANDVRGHLRKFRPCFTAATRNYFCSHQVGEGVRQPGGLATVGDKLALLDQGAAEEHEITAVRPDGFPLNFGWPFLEGTVQVSAPPPTVTLTNPNVVYGVGDEPREGLGPVGGVDYRGAISGLIDRFVFADRSGAIWSLPRNLLTGGMGMDVRFLERRTEDFLPNEGTLDEIVDLAADIDGTIYILDADGELYRVDAA